MNNAEREKVEAGSGCSMLTVKQVSERLGISVALTYAEIKHGRLPFHRFGKCAYRVSEADLETYITSRRLGKREEPPKKAPRPKLKHIRI